MLHLVSLKIVFATVVAISRNIGLEIPVRFELSNTRQMFEACEVTFIEYRIYSKPKVL